MIATPASGAAFSDAGGSPRQALILADARMYRAKLERRAAFGKPLGEPSPMRPVQLPPKVKRANDNRLLRSFHHAFEGILYTTLTQPNMRFHLAAGAFVLFATLYLRLERFYVAIIVILIALVLAFELINTAVEAIVDLMTLAHHPLAKVAKDTAAGAVLIVALAAVVVGYLVFYEGVTAGGNRVLTAVAMVPAHLVFVALAVVAIATIFAKAFVRRGSPLQGGAVSGHAALAFAAATLIGLLAGNPLVALLAFFVALLVAQSRVEGGIHSLSEVVLGGILGAGVCYAIFVLARSPHVL
ncbi:MAG: diacylglycerol kinase [Vulcanimicrobiaceae bacterium]